MDKTIERNDVKVGDILEIGLENGLVLRGIVEIKKTTACWVRFTTFNDEAYTNVIGTQVTFYFNESISFDGHDVEWIGKIPKKRTLHEMDYIEMMQFAVDTNDRKWFDRLGKRLAAHKQMKRGKQIENQNSI